MLFSPVFAKLQPASPIRAQLPRRPLASFLGRTSTSLFLIPHSSPHCPPSTDLPCPVGVTAPYRLKSFSCNTYGFPRKCGKQKTYGTAKPFRCNTYKKHGGGREIRPRRNVSTRVSDLSSFLSHYCALFCSHPELNSFVFRRFRTLWQKHPGWGYIFTPKDSPPHLLLAAYFGLPPRPAWHPPSTVLSYRGHYATLSPRPFFPSLPPYLLASILAACSCHSARKPAHHPLRAQSRSCAGLQAYRPRRQTGHSCRFPRQSHPSEFLGHLVRTLPRRNSRPRRAPEQIQGPTPDSRPRGGR